MLKKIGKCIGVIAKNLAIALFFASLIIAVTNVFFGKEIEENISLINLISIDRKNTNDDSKKITFDTVEKRLSTYPLWGKVWATLKVPTIELEQNIYQGDTLDLLLYGVGHYSGSYFPGEGGTILFSGHNNGKYLRKIEYLKPGEKIIVDAEYGTYTYEMVESKILKIEELENLEIKQDEEQLIIYTCYPFDTIGYKANRYVVFAKLVEVTYE